MPRGLSTSGIITHVKREHVIYRLFIKIALPSHNDFTICLPIPPGMFQVTKKRTLTM